MSVRAILMRILSCQSANRVGSIKLLGGQDMQSGKETLTELTIQSSFSRGYWRRSNCGRIGAAELESIFYSQGELGTV